MRPGEDLLKVGGTMEAAGVLHSLFYSSGRPGAAVAPSPGLAGAALTSYAGQIPFTNPSGGQNAYLAAIEASALQAGELIVCDRLWHNSGITITQTTAHTINSVAWPARDKNGSTNGDGVLIGLEASTAIGGGAVTNTTLGYTDEANNAGLTATMASWPATAQAGTFVPFQLAVGDLGVRSIQSLTLGTTYTSGTIHLVAYRVLARLPVPPNYGAFKDALQLGLPRCFDNTVPFLLWMPSATTATTVSGNVHFSHVTP